jgi:2-C-methyl-D-erythritol 2,4-cyclodiphosphate synthase
MYAGIGYDVHRFVENRKLVLGGVSFDYFLGLAGYFDVDVVLYVVGDVILGVASLGDIGELFPDIDDKWKGILS